MKSSPNRPVLRHSHPSRSYQVVAPSRRRPTYTTSSGPWTPLEFFKHFLCSNQFILQLDTAWPTYRVHKQNYNFYPNPFLPVKFNPLSKTPLNLLYPLGTIRATNVYNLFKFDNKRTCNSIIYAVTAFDVLLCGRLNQSNNLWFSRS